MDYYDTSSSNEKKICPLTGEPPSGRFIECYLSDCKRVGPNTCGTLYGKEYRCDAEKNMIKYEHDKEIKKAMEKERFQDSLIRARKTDINQFFHYCNTIDRNMIKRRQEYKENMSINPYHQPEDKCLVYLFEGEKVVEISCVDNLFSFMSSRFERLRSSDPAGAICVCDVPGYLSDAINVRLRLLHNMDVSGVLYYDNPVYIKSRALTKYISTVYGMTWYEFKKLHERHLEITEIVNFDNIIYIKQELDDIIQRERYVKKKKDEEKI